MSLSLYQQIEELLRQSGSKNEIEAVLKQLLAAHENETVDSAEATSIAALLADRRDELLANEAVPGTIKSGFHAIDEMLGGLLSNEFMVVGGRPAMGKTQFLANLALNVSQHIPVLYVSFDLDIYQITNKLISTLSGVEFKHLIHKKLTQQEQKRLKIAKAEMAKHQLLITDSYNGSLSCFRAMCAKYIQEQGVKLILIDELQTMIPDSTDSENRWQEISYIGKALKAIARDFNVCVVVTSQLSNDIEWREGSFLGKRPRLSDLREGRALEYDADKILLMHRPDYYGFIEDAQGNLLLGNTEMIVAKNQTGPLGTFTIKRTSNFSSFLDFKEMCWS